MRERLVRGGCADLDQFLLEYFAGWLILELNQSTLDQSLNEVLLLLPHRGLYLEDEYDKIHQAGQEVSDGGGCIFVLLVLALEEEVEDVCE